MSKSKKVKSVKFRLPKKNSARASMYLDESGDPSIRSKKGKFILTGVIADNKSLEDYRPYYIQLKRKYFGFTESLHAVEIFNAARKDSKSLFYTNDKKKKEFINELANLIDLLPFFSFTIIVDIQAIKKSIKEVSIRRPYDTTLGEAIRIYKKAHSEVNDFEEINAKDLFSILRSYKIPASKDNYPLEIALTKSIELFIERFLKNRNFCDSNKTGEIFYEDNSQSQDILKIINGLKDQGASKGKLTSFAKRFRSKVYCVSFPNKQSKHLGLELADIISYGFHLKSHKKLSKNEFYKPIWQKLKERFKEYESVNWEHVFDIKE
jgi:hypothetical protein